MTEVDGKVILVAGADMANSDWIRAARLQVRAEAGDTAAAAELEHLFNTPSEGVLIEEED